MKKEKLYIEYELRSRSRTIIWNLISTEEGLSKWIADEVKVNGDRLTFQWGDVIGDHEIRTATLIRQVKNRLIQFRWDDEEDETVEIAIVHLDLTDSYLLAITDYVDPDDIDAMRDLWDSNMNQLHQNSGI